MDLSHVGAAGAEQGLQHELAARSKLVAAEVWLDEPHNLLHDAGVLHGPLHQQSRQRAAHQKKKKCGT